MKKHIIYSLILLAALFTAAISGCSKNLATGDYSVDHYSLVRSAVYTQRELINIGLNSESQTGSQRQTLLLHSYCDLIDRRTIYAANQPQGCSQLQAENRSCISQFHRCLKNCQLRSQDCRRCEQPAIACSSEELL